MLKKKKIPKHIFEEEKIYKCIFFILAQLFEDLWTPPIMMPEPVANFSLSGGFLCHCFFHCLCLFVRHWGFPLNDVRTPPTFTNDALSEPVADFYSNCETLLQFFENSFHHFRSPGKSSTRLSSLTFDWCKNLLLWAGKCPDISIHTFDQTG